MPSQILHTLFGEDIIAALDSRQGTGSSFEQIKTVYRGAFVLGCQGPDIFYHNQRTRPLALKYGILLHRRDYGIFCDNLLKISMDGLSVDVDGMSIYPQNALGAYTLGFLTHAVLDRFCHPYIIYKSAGEGGMNHPFFERIIDVLMLKELRQQETASWNQLLLAETCENPPPGLKCLIIRALASAFPEKAGRDNDLSRRIDNALCDSARYYRLSNPAQTCLNVWCKSNHPPIDSRYISLIFPDNLPTDIDFLNMKRKPWFYPYQMPHSTEAPKADTRSLTGIYADALQAAINSLQNPGNGCLSIHDETGKHCAPNFTDPLPLGEVLEEQMRMRNEELGVKNCCS